MKYQDVEYGVQRLAPGAFLWTIYPRTGQRAKIESKVFHPTQEEAEAACRKVIDQSRSRNTAPN
jgi:predicted DNA-binding WGR domain protein